MKRLESNGDTKRHRGLTLRALRCKTNLMCCLERNENPRSPTWTSMDGNGYSSTFECVCVCFGMCPEIIPRDLSDQNAPLPSISLSLSLSLVLRLWYS